ncbi:hypothetical protein ACH347_11440 [Saccharopolyspora sp. 5N102]
MHLTGAVAQLAVLEREHVAHQATAADTTGSLTPGGVVSTSA